MFLEVAAFRVPCRHPLMPDATCLQVRERKYDERRQIPSDASSFEYVLDLKVESEIVPRR